MVWRLQDDGVEMAVVVANAYVRQKKTGDVDPARKLQARGGGPTREEIQGGGGGAAFSFFILIRKKDTANDQTRPSGGDC